MLSKTKIYSIRDNELPIEDDLSGAAFFLLILPVTFRFHTIQWADGVLGSHVTNTRLKINDILQIAQESFSSSKPPFIPTDYLENASTTVQIWIIKI